MKGFKGYEKGLVCRGKQYAENTVFEEKEAVVCNKGMHFCENPMDVLGFYPILDDNAEFNDFTDVEALAETKTDDNRKYCTTKLKIGAKLSFKVFVKACVDLMIEKTTIKPEEVDKMIKDASGDSSKLAASGYSSQLAASGNYSKLAASGYSSQLAASGYSSQLAASGDYSQLAASGDYSQLAASGNYSKLAASGDSSQLAASGYSSQLAASGYYSVVAGIGINNTAKAKNGCWITLAEWEYSEEKELYIPVCVKTEYVDGERIKEDTWYKLQNGEFVEVDNG